MNEQRQGQRIDKWLWHARIFKSRTLAAKLAETGKIRLTKGEERTKVSKPSHVVHVGDVLTFPKDRRIRVLRILDIGHRRGPAIEAQTLYEDLTEPEIATQKKDGQSTAMRDEGSGRPTKKERRATDRLRNR